jgi:DNA polymerase (family 10)
MVRGDRAEEALLGRAAELVRAHHVASESDIRPLFEDPPPNADAGSLKRLRQMYEAGGWVLVESALADLPADLRWLFESGSVTLDQLAAIHRSYGATSAADLAAAVREQALRTLPGFDAAVEAAVEAALPTLRASIPRIPLGRATGIARPILELLRAQAGVRWALPAGSLRRGQDLVGDIVIVAPAADPAPIIAELLELPDAPHCLHRSPRRLCLRTDRAQLAVRVPEPANAGATLLYLTGSAGHFEALRAHAAIRNWRLTAGGLFALDGTLHPAETEEDIYGTLGLPVIPPEIRNGEEEIRAALAGTLPTLVSRDDIRGDLHMHTMWSDGVDSVASMVEACRTLGYQYMAITDHSPHSAATRNLTADGATRQAEEIAALREQFPDIVILHGCEVDILPNGQLDFPDRILQRFDIVLASLHERAGQSPEQLMRRYTSAMKHPLVTLVSHPTNRLIPHRRGYDLDYGRLFDTAVQTRTAVEIDGAPVHLDLDGALARQAIAAGAAVAISSDGHRAEMLGRQMEFGLLTARRGWAEPRHVLNTRPIDDVRTFIAAKRGAG